MSRGTHALIDRPHAPGLAFSDISISGNHRCEIQVFQLYTVFRDRGVAPATVASYGLVVLHDMTCSLRRIYTVLRHRVHCIRPAPPATFYPTRFPQDG